MFVTTFRIRSWKVFFFKYELFCYSMSFLADCFLTRLLTVFRKMMMNYSPSKKPTPESRRKSWNRWETTTCLETRVTSLAIFRANPRDLKRKSLQPLHPKTTYSLRVRLLEVCNSFCYGKISIYYWFMKVFPECELKKKYEEEWYRQFCGEIDCSTE